MDLEEPNQCLVFVSGIALFKDTMNLNCPYNLPALNLPNKVIAKCSSNLKFPLCILAIRKSTAK